MASGTQVDAWQRRNCLRCWNCKDSAHFDIVYAETETIYRVYWSRVAGINGHKFVLDDLYSNIETDLCSWDCWKQYWEDVLISLQKGAWCVVAFESTLVSKPYRSVCIWKHINRLWTWWYQNHCIWKVHICLMNEYCSCNWVSNPFVWYDKLQHAMISWILSE